MVQMEVMERPLQNDHGGPPNGIKINIGRALTKQRSKGKSSIFGNDPDEEDGRADKGDLIGSILGGEVE